MQMPRLFNQTIDEIISADASVAPVLEHFGIDTSKEGEATLALACEVKGICPISLYRELIAAKNPPLEEK